MSMANPVAISVETPRIYKGCSLNKDFIELLYMNFLMVFDGELFQNMNTRVTNEPILFLNHEFEKLSIQLNG